MEYLTKQERLEKNFAALDFHNQTKDEIKLITNDFLTGLGLKYFSYGRYYYKENKCYYINNVPGYHQNIILNNDCINHSAYLSVWNSLGVGESREWLWGTDKETANALADNNVFNPFHIAIKNSKYIEHIGFAVDKPDMGLINIYLNKGNIWGIVVEEFKKRAEDLIKKMGNVNLYLPEYPNLSSCKSAINITTLFESIKNHSQVNLTPKETTCLKFLSQNKTYKQIAYDMGISNRTIEGHIANIKDKTGLNNKYQLTDFYNKRLMKHGIFD